MLDACLIGCDFSSSPNKRKPIVVAWGRCQGARVHLERLQRCDSLSEWGQLMAQDGDWVGGFDLPFGLPRALVAQLNWPQTWRACMDHYAALEREQRVSLVIGSAQTGGLLERREIGGLVLRRAAAGGERPYAGVADVPFTARDLRNASLRRRHSVSDDTTGMPSSDCSSASTASNRIGVLFACSLASTRCAAGGMEPSR
mgnify:CR=1 FL=1